MKVHKNITITGQLADEPELRFTPFGRPVLTMHVYVGAENEIRHVQVWDALAENIVAQKTDDAWERWAYRGGVTVTVTGRKSVQEWTGADGNLHSREIINATEVRLG